jgi:hypothetical protein
MLGYFGAGRLFGHQANLSPSALISAAPELEYLATEALSLSFGVSIDLVGKRTTDEITPLLSMYYAS